MIEDMVVVGLFLFVFPLIAYLIGRYFGGKAAWCHADELVRCKMEAGERIAERDCKHYEYVLMMERERATRDRAELARERDLREQMVHERVREGREETSADILPVAVRTLLRHFEFVTADRAMQCFYCRVSLDSHIALVCRGCGAAAHQQCVLDNDGLCGRYGCENAREE